MTEYVTLFGKKYPKALIIYVMSKDKDRKISDLTEKYLDEMRDVVRSEIKRGIDKGKLYTFFPTMIPVWRDVAEAYGYTVINVKENKDSGTFSAEVAKNITERKKPKQTKSNIKRKYCKCK